MIAGRPLRFLALTLGLWVMVRAVAFAPGWWDAPDEPGPAFARPAAAAGGIVLAGPVPIAPPGPTIGARPYRPPNSGDRAGRGVLAASRRPDPALSARGDGAGDAGRRQRGAHGRHRRARPGSPRTAGCNARAPALGGVGLAAGSARRGRGGAGAGRDPRRQPGRSAAAAPARRRLRAERPTLTLPLRRIGGAEAAAGLDWQPSARLPVHVLAERRQALGGEGRSAFGLTLYGGLSRDLPRGFRINAYGQAGLVGLRARDPFADGSVRVSAPLGPIEIGGGAWAAAQPGAARVDAGPSVSWRLPGRAAAIRLQADWRFRLAGEAAPGSGPALTLAADFLSLPQINSRIDRAEEKGAPRNPPS